MKTFYKVFYYKDIELLAYPVGNEPDEEDEEISSKTELAFDYDISANEIECRKELRWRDLIFGQSSECYSDMCWL